MSISPERARKLAAQKDSDIDYSDIPELTDAFFRDAKVMQPQPKQQLTVRFDTDVVEWFRKDGKGYQSRMNAVLKAYVESQR